MKAGTGNGPIHESVAENVQELSRRAAAAEGLEIFDLQVRRDKRSWRISVYIDHDERNVTLEDCQKVSEQLSTLLDVEDVIPVRYNLEVSSPGLDRPLRREGDYDRFAGRLVRITTEEPVDGRRKLEGRIVGIQEGTVVLRCENTELHIPYEDILKARLVVEF